MSAGVPAGDHPIVRARWAVLAVFLGVCAWLLPGVTSIENDDDVLAFLPPDSPAVQDFHAIAKSFGMLEVGLVGLADGGAPVITPEKVDEIRALGKELGAIDGVNIVLSFTDLPNPVVNDEGLVVAPLVPEDMRDAEAIRDQVLGSRDAVGNLVSKDGTAAALLVFLFPRDGGAEAFTARRASLQAIRARVRAGWSGEVHFAGAPFVEMAAADSSRSDIERLSPVVIAVLAAASALLLGSLTAAFLNLFVTGLGVGLIMGAHGVFGEPLTIVSSSTPVMMVALGGAFGVHMLAGYQRQIHGTPRQRASATVRELWLPVLLSGTTTSVAFFALLVMPQVPMQRFGVTAGIGVLLLLVLALLVMPALLAALPQNLIRPRPERSLPLPFHPPLWAMALVGVGGVALATTQMKADPDTSNVFAPRSEVKQSNTFFEQNFGGSTFLQIAIEAPLGDNEVLRLVRDLSEEVLAIDGVADVRSVVEPVAVINAALGGREGVPETEARAGRVLTYLMGHPAMAQLMTDEAGGGLIHVKLAPLDGEGQTRVTREVQAVLDRLRPSDDKLVVARADDEAVARARRASVEARLSRVAGRPISLDGVDPGAAAPAAFLQEIAKLRDTALDDEEGAVAAEIPAAEIQTLTPQSLVTPRGEELEALLRAKLPTLVAEDAEGVKFAAEHLGAWIDEAKTKYAADAWCAALDLESQCEAVRPIAAELSDEHWRAPPGFDPEQAARVVDAKVSLTGQPVIGQAFAASVTTSLWQSTAASIAALALVMLVSRMLFALIPAVWTVAFAAGVIALLGHPISVGTSMVACIALGAGVDFAIHLGVRARAHTGPDAGRKAVDELGAVVFISATQLAFAFVVLAASELLPLQHFGLGLAVGLVGAAIGAVWLTPRLVRS
jgi:predicted RND superfamily exporter protein